MTTTVPTHGGPAHPVNLDTSGKVLGRTAKPVYGFLSAADAAAAGYQCEGGPAQSVYVVSAAQLASGEFVLEGDPKALPMYIAPTGARVEGGYSQPVAVVGGRLQVSGGGSILPLTIDFSTLADGALPSPLVGATWAIASGKAINTPIISNLITNIEFSVNTSGWSAQNVATLTRRDYATSPNIAPTGGADNYGLEVANGGTSNAGAILTAAATVEANAWYTAFVRAYAPSANTTANAGQLVLTNTVANIIGGGNVPTAEDAWQSLQYGVRFTTTSTQQILRCTGATAGDMVHYDKAILGKVTTPFAILPATQADVIVKANLIIVAGMQAGVIARMDSAGTSYLIAYHTGTRIFLDKVIAGTYTNLISSSSTAVSNALLEIRCSGSTVQLWYNGSQVGANQTVADAEIVANKIHGLFAVGVSQATSFFVAAP